MAKTVIFYKHRSSREYWEYVRTTYFYQLWSKLNTVAPKIENSSYVRHSNVRTVPGRIFHYRILFSQMYVHNITSRFYVLVPSTGTLPYWYRYRRINCTSWSIFIQRKIFNNALKLELMGSNIVFIKKKYTIWPFLRKKNLSLDPKGQFKKKIELQFSK